MSKLNGIGKTHRKRFCSRPENFARPFNTMKVVWENSDIKWMKILSINSIVIKYLGIFCEGLKLITDGFWPLVNQFNYTFAYTNSFPIYFLSTKVIWESGKRGLINYLSAWGSDRRLCLKLLPSRKNEIYLWKMAMNVGMYSATNATVTVARGQR